MDLKTAIEVLDHNQYCFINKLPNERSDTNGEYLYQAIDVVIKEVKRDKMPEYNEIFYHARTLNIDQFREYWSEIIRLLHQNSLN